MGATYVQNGCAVDHVALADVAPGDVVVQGDLVGVAVREIKTGALGCLVVEGVFDVPKATGPGAAITAGAKVYWDVAEEVAKTDEEAGANKLIGKTIKAAGDDDPTVRVRLMQ